MPYHTNMERKLLYAFRGWIAFVAFMDLGTAFRSYIERRSFLDHADTQFIEGDFTVSRIIGMYCLLKAFALVHCTLYIHFRPVVSMGGCSLALTLVLYLTEVFYFRSCTLNFYVIFPCVLNCDFTVSRIIGMYCLLKAFALVHCTLYIHFRPVVSMGGCSLALTLVLYLTEVFYFRSCTLNFYVIFPCVLNSVTLVALMYIPKRLRLWEPSLDYDDENSQLLKQMTGFKRRRAKKTQ